MFVSSTAEQKVKPLTLTLKREEQSEEFITICKEDGSSEEIEAGRAVDHLLSLHRNWGKVNPAPIEKCVDECWNHGEAVLIISNPSRGAFIVKQVDAIDPKV